MDILYIPQLDDIDAGGGGSGGGSSGGSAARYLLLRRVPEDGRVALTDHAVTRVEIATDGGPLTLVVPPGTEGAARDFFVRLIVTADEVPEVSFAAPSGETISFEDVDNDVFVCEVGVNVFAFTETDEGIFIVNRKRIDIDQVVEFDPCGGTLDKTSGTFKLGAQYVNLPKPTMDGYMFLGWFTAAEDGVEVAPTDKCKTGVTRLYAHWTEYVDPVGAVICEAGNLTFFTDGDCPWFADGDAARSGAIGDNGTTTLSTTVQGRGILTFRWRTSCEWDYDCLRLRVDGGEFASISGERDWEDFYLPIDGDGQHTVEWLYTKDSSSASGEDCGWIDDVTWTPAE